MSFPETERERVSETERDSVGRRRERKGDSKGRVRTGRFKFGSILELIVFLPLDM